MGDVELATTARQQLGLVTREQARDHLTIRQLAMRLASGRLQVVRRGVYRFAGAPDVPYQEVLAACLAAGVGAVASHRTAAALWGLPGVCDDGVEITVPSPLWARLPGVRCHQSSRLPPRHRDVRLGVPVTSVARTLVDLSTSMDAELLKNLVDASVRQGKTTLDEVRAAYELLAGRGRRRLTVVRAVLDARQPGYQPGDSAAEAGVVETLVVAGLPAPVQQHQVAAGGTVYLLDLAYPELAIGIEYDGWGPHGTRSAFDRDRARGNALALSGWTVLHFTSATGTDELARTVRDAYRRAVARAGPTPTVETREKVAGDAVARARPTPGAETREKIGG